MLSPVFIAAGCPSQIDVPVQWPDNFTARRRYSLVMIEPSGIDSAILLPGIGAYPDGSANPSGEIST
jgi:hypothetical protein